MVSQTADEIAAAAWPDLLVSVAQWDPETAVWRDLGPWEAEAWTTDGVLGDPLPLIAVRTLAKWVVPATDGVVWWWVCVPHRPPVLPVSDADM